MFMKHFGHRIVQQIHNDNVKNCDFTHDDSADNIWWDLCIRNGLLIYYTTVNWDSVLYLAGKRTEPLLSEFLICQSNDNI